MKLPNQRTVLMSLASAALCGVLAAGPAQAADSPCKGLDQAQCTAATGCGWIDGYTRKDGKAVAAYCKKASTPPGAAAGKDKAPAAPPATGKQMAPAAAPPESKATTTGTGTPMGAGSMSMPMPMPVGK